MRRLRNRGQVAGAAETAHVNSQTDAPAPGEAWQAYCDAEQTARAAYEKYWFDRLLAEGMTTSSAGDKFGAYGLVIEIWPHRFEGMKVEIKCGPTTKHPYNHWHLVKVKSETGLRKLVNKLRYNEFE